MNIDLLTSTELTQLRSTINAANHIVICCHKNPDGDALGSSLAWAAFLKHAYGKNVTVVVPDAFPDFLKCINGATDIMRYDTTKLICETLLKNTDLLFCLDFNQTSRTGDMQPLLDCFHGKKILIDHHLNPNMSVMMALSYPNLCSTCEIIFRIIAQMDGLEHMTIDCAQPLYVGMMTDTGAFTYNSTRPEIYCIIGELLAKGVDKDKLYRDVYNNFSADAIHMRGYIMHDKLKVLNELHAAYYIITKEEMKRFNFIKGDAEGLVNIPLRIKGLKLSISLREDDRKPNKVWVSLRSVDDFPANKMAEQFFNGGGHINAAGGHLNCSVNEAEAIVNESIKAYAELLRN